MEMEWVRSHDVCLWFVFQVLTLVFVQNKTKDDTTSPNPGVVNQTSSLLR